MKKVIRDYLTFNRRERNGLFVLLSIIVLLIMFLSISPYFIKEETVDFSRFESEIELLQASLKQAARSSTEQTPQEKKKTLNVERFNFDPNHLSEADWKRLGFNDKQVHTIKNYKNKGGRFKTKADLKKIYGISEDLYLSLEPFIELPDEKPKEKNETRPAINNLLELNSADSAQLVALKGIGTFYAKTIISYRNSLGGFFSKEQLKEVWKLDQLKFDLIKDQVTVDSSRIKKININNCAAKELKHPYLKWHAVNAIINYREKHGKFSSTEEIKKTEVINDEVYLKIKPYLVIE